MNRFIESNTLRNVFICCGVHFDTSMFPRDPSTTGRNNMRLSAQAEMSTTSTPNSSTHPWPCNS